MISFFIGMVCGLWLMYLLQMDKINGLKNRINKAKQYAHERLAFLENCFGGNDIEIRACITIHNEYLKILGGDVDDE